MKSKINYFEGMPVEIPALDETGEQERTHLNALALQEYEDTGALVSEAAGSKHVFSGKSKEAYLAGWGETRLTELKAFRTEA